MINVATKRNLTWYGKGAKMSLNYWEEPVFAPRAIELACVETDSINNEH